MFRAVRRKNVWMIFVKLGNGANAVRREEFRFAQQIASDAFKLAPTHKRKQQARSNSVILVRLDVLGNIRVIIDEPLHAAFETGQTINHVLLEGFHRKQGNQADERANLQVVAFAIGKMKHVVIEPIFVVPEFNAFATTVVHRVGDMDEVFEELTGEAFIGWILAREFQRNGQHVEAIHAHPTGPIGLLEVAAGGQWRGSVEYSDIVQTEEAALKDVHAFGIFPVHPPGEIQQKFVKDAFEEIAISFPADALLDFINTPSGPSVNGRVYISKSPLVGW